MDSKQKEKLRIFLKARKRADKVLAKRREVEREKLEHDLRVKANKELKQKYSLDLTALARESGILALAEQAALDCGGILAQEVSCYLNYGLSASSFPNALGITGRGELRAAFLALRIIWKENGAKKEVEIRVHRKGTITFHNSFVPVFPIIWRWDDQLLQKMLSSAMKHPRPSPISARKSS